MEHQTVTANENIRDAEFDFYGSKMACALEDNNIVIYDTATEVPTLVSTLSGHKEAVWQVKWSHPRFGPVLASCSYDKQVLIWREVQPNKYVSVYSHKAHTKSVNTICFFPDSEGLKLACGSSDGKISILEYVENTKGWRNIMFEAHSAGVNTLIVVSPTRIISGGCDSVVKIHDYINGQWKCVEEIKDHNDWIRDIAAVNKNGKVVIATAGQDGKVFLYEIEGDKAVKVEELPKFKDQCLRVAFNGTGDKIVVSLSSGETEKLALKEGKWVQDQ